MPANYTTTFDADVRDVLTRASIVGRSVVLPPGQLDRKLYERVNKVLELAGGKWNRKAKAHEFASADGVDTFVAALSTGSITDGKKQKQQFFTPPDVVDIIMQRARIEPGMDVLEPSAGAGALAFMARRCGGRVTCVEFDVKLAMALVEEGFNVYPEDFMTWAPELRFHRIVMNPPFAGGQDVKHVMRALKFLRPGGRLVAVMGAGAKSNEWKETKAFREYVIDELHGFFEDLPEGSFIESGTGVRTILLTVEM